MKRLAVVASGLAVVAGLLTWLLIKVPRAPKKPVPLRVEYVVREVDVRTLPLFALLALAGSAQGQVGIFARVTWTDKSTNEDGFRVYMKEAGAPSFATLATLPADTTSYDAPLPLTPQTTYCWAVGAFNAGGENVTPERCEATPPLPGPVAPEAPGDLNVTYSTESPPPPPE